ncbi:MAG: zinc-binding dehydrogenase [Acidobacteriia bacterium]|nr:zinc-binding dehydrogenase [Terriglobia bacterium]MBV9743175.1 zinc-binding dehydrogenase [Terriglobia bacterium]
MLVRAATTIGPLKTEIREYPFPEIPPEAGILQVEAAGVCGSDWRSYQSEKPPRIMGHENVGRIYRLGSIAARRWGLNEGDRVALEEYLPCGYCSFCRSGDARLCEQTESRRPGALRYGTTAVSEAPGLWGGYSQFQYLHPSSIFHRVPEHVPAELAALCLPLANGIQWTCLDGGIGPGQSILIQGPGQQGLACVAAAKASGAGPILISGLERDKDRLAVARALGADHCLNIETEDLEEVVKTVTAGRGVDLSVDTAGGTETTINALRLTREGGRVLFAAAPEVTPAGFPLSDLLNRRLLLRPCRGHSFAAVELALEYIASGRFPLERVATHSFGLNDVDLALRSVGGQGAPGAIHVTVLPWE